MLLRWTLTFTTGVTGGSQQILELSKDPKGWEELTLKVRRDMQFHGLFYEFTFEMGFYCNGGGKELIDLAYDTDGIDATLDIDIEYNCNGTFENVFKGKLNFGTYNRQGSITNINIEKRTIIPTLKARIDNQVDISNRESLDGTTLDTLDFLDFDISAYSKTILLEADLEYDGIEVRGTTFRGEVGNIYRMYFSHDYPAVKSTLERTVDNPSIEFFGVQAGTSPDVCEGYTFFINEEIGLQPFVDLSQNDILTFPAVLQIDYNFIGTFTDTMASGESRRAGWRLLLARGTTISDFFYIGGGDGEFIELDSFSYGFDSSDTINATFSATGSTTLIANEADKIWLFWATDTPQYEFNPATQPAGSCPITVLSWRYTTANIQIDAISSIGTVPVDVFMAHEAFTRTLGKILNRDDLLRSNFFGRTNANAPAKATKELYSDNGCGAFTSLTNGLRLRAIESAPMYVSFIELFAAMNTVWNIGMEVEEINDIEYIRIEDTKFFYNDTIILDASDDNTQNLSMKIDESYFYSLVRIGFPTWEPESQNGLDEPNTIHEYSTPLSQTNTVYEANTNYIAGMYALEVQKRFRTPGIVFGTEEYRTEKDRSYDNNNFFIAINRLLLRGIPLLQQPEADGFLNSIQDLFGSSSAYNLRYTPKRCLLRHMNLISAGLTKKPGSELKFAYGEGNTVMKTTMRIDNCDGDFSGVEIGEDDNLQWDDGMLRQNEPIFIPEVYEFDYKLNFREFKIIQANPKGVVQFGDFDGLKKGYILEMDYSLIKGLAHFVLIRKFES